MKKDSYNTGIEPQIKEVIHQACQHLRAKGLTNPRVDIEYLLELLLGLDKTGVFLSNDKKLDKDDYSKFCNWVDERAEHKPVEYIVGQTQFYGLWMDINRNVLIPRPETEVLVEYVIENYKKHNRTRIIDLGTGSGAIAVGIANHIECTICAADISLKALEVARKNVTRYHLADKIELFLSDWFQGLDIRPVNLVISNPPYVADKDWMSLPPEVRSYEPEIALRGGVDGLKHYSLIIAGAYNYLLPDGELILEIGWNQADAVKSIMAGSGKYSDIEVLKDYDRKDRIVVGRKRG